MTISTLFTAAAERPVSSRTATRNVVSGERLKWWAELKEPNLGQLIPEPQVQIPELLLTKEDWPADLRSQEDFSKVAPLFKLMDEEDFEKAYVQSDRIRSKLSRSSQGEWVTLLKADLYYQVQSHRGEPQWSMVLEEYSDFLRDYPLHPQNSRVLYQMALIQLKMKFLRDVEQTVQRALKEYPTSALEPYYHLLLGEAAFIGNDDRKSNFEFSSIIQRYPNHSTSIDAAFRKALILFRQGHFQEAMDVYETLEKLHSDQFEKLKAGRPSQTKDRYLDRILYSETIFQNFKYKEAARLFQDLANIFPTAEEAPLLFLRLGDTYLRRNKVSAAIELYRDIEKRYPDNPRAQTLTQLRIADAFFMSDTVGAQRFSEEKYLSAYEKSKETNDPLLISLALAKLASFHLFNQTFVKAQAVLRAYRQDYKDTANAEWVEKQFARTVEIEIQDHYNREDYLAALSTYLTLESENANFFKDTAVLMKLADAARRLGLLEKATTILNRVVYLDKSSMGRQEALLELVGISISKNELKKASERLRRFRFAYPKTTWDSRLEELWGDLYGKLSNRSGAVEHYEKAIRLAKSSPVDSFTKRYVHLRLGELYQEEALPLKAIDAFEDYLSQVNDKRKSPLTKNLISKKDDFLYRATRYRIADMFFDMKDFVRALEAYGKVAEEIKDEPFQSHALYRMGECYLALDDRKAAISVFEKLIKKEAKSIWLTAAKSYIDTVTMEVKYGIRILN